MIEIMVQKLYAKWGISDRSHFDRMNSYDYPVLSDLYGFMEEEYKRFDEMVNRFIRQQCCRESCWGCIPYA